MPGTSILGGDVRIADDLEQQHLFEVVGIHRLLHLTAIVVYSAGAVKWVYAEPVVGAGAERWDGRRKVLERLSLTPQHL